MADKAVLKDLLFALGGYRISKDANNFVVGLKRGAPDCGGFEDAADRYLKGTYQHDLKLSGHLTQRETMLVSELNAEGSAIPFTVCLDSGKAVGDFALIGGVQLLGMQVLGGRGDVAPFSVDLMPDERWFGFWTGKLFYNNVGAAAIGSGVTNGAGVNLGAIGAGKVGIFSLHVVDPPGITGTTPTLNTIVESDAADDFLSPITQATFAQVTTTPSGQLIVIDGDVTPITDTWWRPKHTGAGTNPGYTVLMGAAVLTKST